MKLKIILTVMLNVGLAGLMLQGGAGGCGTGSPPPTVATLDGTYDCVDGCDGDCTYSETIEMVLGDFEGGGYTLLSVTGSISTANNIFDESNGGGVTDDGSFGFGLKSSPNGEEMLCDGPPVVDDMVVINCAAQEVVDGAIVMTTCQQVTYKKR